MKRYLILLWPIGVWKEVDYDRYQTWRGYKRIEIK